MAEGAEVTGRDREGGVMVMVNERCFLTPLAGPREARGTRRAV